MLVHQFLRPLQHQLYTLYQQGNKLTLLCFSWVRCFQLRQLSLNKCLLGVCCGSLYKCPRNMYWRNKWCIMPEILQLLQIRGDMFTLRVWICSTKRWILLFTCTCSRLVQGRILFPYVSIMSGRLYRGSWIWLHIRTNLHLQCWTRLLNVFGWEYMLIM